MNFIRTRFATGRLMGQWRRQVMETGSVRRMCDKPQEAKAEPQPAVPPRADHLGFKIPGYKPSEFDKKMLLWSGRFKTADQIPELVSFETIDAARNNVRVKVCYGMMVATIMACLMMVISGKRAAARHESLTKQNMEKKARWREELQREREAAAAMSEKAQ